MSSRFFLLFGLASLLLVVIESHSGDHHHIDFSYLGWNGPQKWGSLSPNYAECAKGKAQSPINIITKEVIKNNKLKPLVRHYHSTNATLINNGFNIGMKYNHDVGVVSIDGKNHTLLQMHWHTPSEHRIDDQQFPAELHLVHMSDQGELAVVAILFKYGNSDPLLSKLKLELEEIKKEKEEKEEEGWVSIEKVNINKYLYLMRRKKMMMYLRYMGSLTTPPCSENVVWNILTKVMSISKEQVDLLHAPLDSAYKSNCRPPQPLNGRIVQLYNNS
ncbi:unnamed protein product [Rhodiola kirilowii]